MMILRRSVSIRAVPADAGKAGIGGGCRENGATISNGWIAKGD
jgi:hypothetical protein